MTDLPQTTRSKFEDARAGSLAAWEQVAAARVALQLAQAAVADAETRYHAAKIVEAQARHDLASRVKEEMDA